MPHASGLPINVRDLLYQRGVESSRIEFKRSWNDGPTAYQVLKTVCAFANDIHNLNGGYVVLGVEEQGGKAVLPPAGLDSHRLENIQKEIRGLCCRLDPEYQPVLCPEVVEGRHILVVWVPGSDNRPHSAPAALEHKKRSERRPRQYFVRLGAETVEAQGQTLADLLRMTARVPFDDRPARSHRLGDLRSTLVREFLRETGSGLVDWEDDLALYRHLKLSSPMNGHEVPRNVALMFFSDDPETAFPGARIEVVEFAESGDNLKEQTFRGSFLRQVRDCQSFLRNRTAEYVRKVPHRAESEVWESYPFPALEEAVVNAVCHRGYEDAREPTKLYLYPDRIEVTSYPGPVVGLELHHFAEGHQPPPVPARNRRIGELFKDVRMAEQRGTGVTKIRRSMAANGSPPPRFEFDRDRTYFTVVLPIHPAALAAAGTAPTGVSASASSAADGLILVSIGRKSIRPQVEQWRKALGLEQAQVLELPVLDYIEADPEHFEAVARQLRDELRKHVENPEIERLHLFYAGPLALAPLLGAVAASSTKPLRVYHYENGRYVAAYTLDRRFLIAKD